MNNINTYNIDAEIKNIDNVIFQNIERDKNYDRGFMSQNILTRLRNLIEHIALKLLSMSEDVELEINYNNIQRAVGFIKKIAQYRFLSDFHRFVQNSVGHLTPTNENAERLMLKYYEYLIKIKKFYKNYFGIDILNNINKFPLNTDKTYYEYYGEIAKKVDSIAMINDRKFDDGRYYVQKIKPFFIKNTIYYEVTLSSVQGSTNKFDRNTLFTKCEINTNYAIKISTVKVRAKIFGANTDIQIINNWQIAIRACEIKNMYKIFGEQIEFAEGYKEYRAIMPFLTKYGYSLLDLADLEQEDYEKIKTFFYPSSQTHNIFKLIDKCRDIFENNKKGTNILRYLLYKCNNVIIKKQYEYQPNEQLSNLYLTHKSIPFEDMPFASALCGHNPKRYDLFECLDVTGREDELLAKYVQQNTEQKGCLYTLKSELKVFGNVEELVERYNSKLYYNHQNRRLIIEGDRVYIKVYEENTIKIIKKLQALSMQGIQGYKASVKEWLNSQNKILNDEKQKYVLENLFDNSKVAFIYGSAGTGKTTMIKYISDYYNDDEKIFLANTNPAVENLRAKVKAKNSQFYTIRRILTNSRIIKECKVLVIDECSTVSNGDMLSILNNIDFELLILVGDIYQIESITFGNWFGIAKILIDERAKYELKKPFRSKNENLKRLWEKVRNLDDDITEWMAKNRYSETLNEKILETTGEDEIILCLNYDGLYGINNINRFMQNTNKNNAVDWRISTYKVGDPILFNESKRFSPIIYNNMKGKIVGISLEDNRIWFDIEIYTEIDEFDAENVGLELIEYSKNKSIIRFYVNEYKDLGEDDLESESVVPFSIAYAVSIHKAQGLEYNSVKIIITKEIEEEISHNIFYTAITRAMEKLKIYWTPECQKQVISTMKPSFNKEDANIIKNKILNNRY